MGIYEFRDQISNVQMSYDEAMEALKWRPEMTEVLKLSQIVKGATGS